MKAANKVSNNIPVFSTQLFIPEIEPNNLGGNVQPYVMKIYYRDSPF